MSAEVARNKAYQAGEFIDQVEALRKQIAGLETERSGIENAGLTIDQAMKNVGAWISRQKQTYLDNIAVSDFKEDLPVSAYNIRLAPMTFDKEDFAGDARTAVVSMNPVLCMFFEDQVRAQIRAKLTPLLARNTGAYTKAEQVQRLHEIEAQLFALELAEENIIVDAQRAGIEIERRTSVNPAAVLALRDSEGGAL